jgi:hypothetical protein
VAELRKASRCLFKKAHKLALEADQAWDAAIGAAKAAAKTERSTATAAAAAAPSAAAAANDSTGVASACEAVCTPAAASDSGVNGTAAAAVAKAEKPIDQLTAFAAEMEVRSVGGAMRGRSLGGTARRA